MAPGVAPTAARGPLVLPALEVGVRGAAPAARPIGSSGDAPSGSPRKRRRSPDPPGLANRASASRNRAGESSSPWRPRPPLLHRRARSPRPAPRRGALPTDRRRESLRGPPAFLRGKGDASSPAPFPDGDSRRRTLPVLPPPAFGSPLPGPPPGKRLSRRANSPRSRRGRSRWRGRRAGPPRAPSGAKWRPRLPG